MSSDKITKEDVVLAVRKAYKLKKEMEIAKTEYDMHIETIKKYFDKYKIKSLRVEREDNMQEDMIKKQFLHINVKVIEKNYIEYDPYVLKEKLKKEIFNKVVETKYYINNINEFIKALKENNITSKNIKNFIIPEYSVNKEAIKQAYNIGEITKNDLEGAYKIKVIKSIQLKEG